MYLESAAHWWRTGEQTRITRPGSPLSFWKLQQVPMLWTLDRLGYGDWIDDPKQYEARAARRWRGPRRSGSGSRPSAWSRAGAVACTGPARWCWPRGGSRMSPNLLAHGPLVTMETPILAAMTGDVRSSSGCSSGPADRRAFVASAVVGGLAFSCKFTAVARAADLRACSG